MVDSVCSLFFPRRNLTDDLPSLSNFCKASYTAMHQRADEEPTSPAQHIETAKDTVLTEEESGYESSVTEETGLGASSPGSVRFADAITAEPEKTTADFKTQSTSSFALDKKEQHEKVRMAALVKVRSSF